MEFYFYPICNTENIKKIENTCIYKVLICAYINSIYR